MHSVQGEYYWLLRTRVERVKARDEKKNEVSGNKCGIHHIEELKLYPNDGNKL